jgi:DNA-binding MarR family transcriptional regulator
MSRVRDEVSRGGLRRTDLLAWLRLMRVYQKVDRASAEHLRGWGLSVAQFDVLARVGSQAGIKQQEVADLLLVTKGNVCQLLDRMEDRGLLLRRRDGRANHLFLTEAGQRLYDGAVPAQEAMVSERFSALSDEEQAQLHELLRKLDTSLG